MSDIAKGANADGANAGAPGPGTVGGKPPLTIHAQYIKDMSFENPLSPGSLMPLNKQPRIDLNVMVKMRKLEESTYEVALIMGADARNSENSDALFMIELVYCAVVTLGEVPQEALGPLLLIETPRLLFPFARAIIANSTREAGFPPLQVAPVDFVQLYQQQQQQARNEEQQNAAPATAEAKLN
jgi:preprotein translocase subunit SecB